jgi:CheY-like chemotaxis protein
MGGELSLWSQPGAGSTFWFEVPLGVAAPAERKTPLRGWRLALVVDPGASGELLRGLCQGLGAACAVAAPGAPVDPCDAVLVDEGHDGIERGSALRAQGYAGPMLLVGHPRLGLHARALAAGFTGLCPKPLRRDVLRAAVAATRDKSEWQAPVEAPPLIVPGRVLVVDDNRINQIVAVAMLHKLGCPPGDVDTAENGRLALDALQRVPYALVLMDCEMPEMDGLDATRTLRKLPGPVARVPVLGMTARTAPEDLAACLDAGMDAYLTKPVAVSGLRSAIQALGLQG